MDIEAATRDELLAYAKDVKHLELHSNIKTDQLRKKLLGTEVTETNVDTDNERIKIIVQASDDDSGGDDVFIGVNGRHYLLQRGEEVTVPMSVVHVLENARKTVYRSVVDRTTGRRSLESREVLSYPFHKVG